MSVYKYPTIQKVIKDSLFLMASTVISHSYNSYCIWYIKHGVQSGKILHTDLVNYLESGKLNIESKYNFANGIPFIRIPLKYFTNVI